MITPLVQKTEKLSQQNLLRYAMQITNKSRKEFAELFGITQRSLNSWLLPDDSNGFRPMDIRYQDYVQTLLTELSLQEINAILVGELSDRVPIIHCDKFDFNFPTIFRLTMNVNAVNERGERAPEKDYQRIKYSLAATIPKDRLERNSQQIIKAEPVTKRNTPDDWGWLYITEHRTIERADAYLQGINDMVMDPRVRIENGMYKFGGRFFTLTHTEKPHGEDVPNLLTLYRSDEYFEIAHFNIGGKIKLHVRENEWRLTVDAEGKKAEPYDWDAASYL